MEKIFVDTSGWVALFVKNIDKIIAGVIGLITGAIGSLIAPWVQWGIEKRRIKQKRRIELLEEWRRIISKPNFDRKDLLESPYYASLRNLLKEEVRKEIERPSNSFRVKLNSPTGNYDKDLLLEEIARIEKEWGLI